MERVMRKVHHLASLSLLITVFGGCAPFEEPAAGEDGRGEGDEAQGNVVVQALTVDLNWSHAGPVAGKTYCTSMNEPADPYTWGDNYLCSSLNHGIVWNNAGPVAGMRCTNINEPADPHAWADNYLCVPPTSTLTFEWSYGGPIYGRTCIQVNEPADPHAWADNYLCY